MTDLRIVIKNVSPDGGLFLTPFWFGFHNDAFDLFDSGSPASAGLEQIAEDGDAAGLAAELVAADADAQGFVVAGAAGPIATLETTQMTVSVDGVSNAFVDFAAMILPSNDAFIGTGFSRRLFNIDGQFVGEQNISFAGDMVYDAGTEVNTETDAAFINQTSPNSGMAEGGVVRLHSGFNGSAGNPEGEGEMNILGGVNAFGEPIDPEAADFTIDGAQIATVHINVARRVDGTQRADVFQGGVEDDIVNAGAGNDRINGGRGWDVIDGGEGDDVIAGARGDDSLDGGAGEDIIFSGAGDDTARGGDDDDRIWGGLGNDALAGEEGADVLRGGSGDDTLYGGEGDDTLFGNTGADVFVFSADVGADVVRDFRVGEDMLLFMAAGFDDVADVIAAARAVEDGVEIALGEGASTVLRGVDLDDLAMSDFLFG